MFVVEGTALWMTSTPAGPQNYYSLMYDMRGPDGKSLFHTTFLGPKNDNVYDDGANKTETKTQQFRLPDHHDPEIHSRLSFAMKAIGRGDTSAQELQGINAQKTKCPFEAQSIDWTFTSNRDLWCNETYEQNVQDVNQENIREIICTLDTGYSNNSKSSILYGYRNLRTGERVVSIFSVCV